MENHLHEKIINELSLNTVINEQLKYFEALASKKRITITTNLEEFEYKINEDDFIRVFNNLVSNAIKYNKMGGEIDISLKNKILTIKDTGIGIQEEKVKNIFDRYYRATSEQGGFGIGLNIVSKICCKNRSKPDNDARVRPDAKTEFNRTVKRCSTGH